MRKPLLVVSAVVLGAALATPAAAGVDTLVTVPVGASGLLAITALPAAVVEPGTPAIATIATTVTDARLSNSAGWVATIASTDLTLAGVSSPGAAGTIAASTMTAYTGVVVPNLVGTATLSSPFTSAGSGLTLSNAAQTLVSATSRSNLNTAVYTTSISIPTTGKTVGIYTGTVTQSVA